MEADQPSGGKIPLPVGKECGILPSSPEQALKERRYGMKIGLAYAMTGEIESILSAAGARLLETPCGVPFYEL